MKKSGFTLAEVLVTLGIIGVIAALTMPTFTQNTQKNKIGPKLAKARAVFEQAMQAVLDDANVDAISDVIVKCSDDATSTQTLLPPSGSQSNGQACFWYNMGKHMKGSYGMVNDQYTDANGNTYATTYGYFTGSDGVSYRLINPRVYTTLPSLSADAGVIRIDINGADNPPNAEARDRFEFTLWNDGTLTPYGSNGSWRTGCHENETPTIPSQCTGHIFENNLKVLYK